MSLEETKIRSSDIWGAKDGLQWKAQTEVSAYEPKIWSFSWFENVLQNNASAILLDVQNIGTISF